LSSDQVAEEKTWRFKWRWPHKIDSRWKCQMSIFVHIWVGCMLFYPCHFSIVFWDGDFNEVDTCKLWRAIHATKVWVVISPLLVVAIRSCCQIHPLWVKEARKTNFKGICVYIQGSNLMVKFEDSCNSPNQGNKYKLSSPLL
jgi:hypothetical protein